MLPAVAIIGAGRVGTAIGAILHQQGYPIRGVARRSMARAEEAVRFIGAGTPTTDPVQAAEGADIVFVTVPDSLVAEVAAVLGSGRSFGPDDLLIHTSGALPADALVAPGTEQALHLSLHPIQTIAEPQSGIERLKGSAFGLEGSPEAVERGKKLVEAMGGVPLVIAPGQKALYHAASCVMSNYLIGLIDAGLELYQLAGIPRDQALAAVGPLLQGTLDNVIRLGLPAALTGPIERGDLGTIERHMQALGQVDSAEQRKRLEQMYRLLGVQTLNVAAQKSGGLSPAHQGIQKLLLRKE